MSLELTEAEKAVLESGDDGEEVISRTGLEDGGEEVFEEDETGELDGNGDAEQAEGDTQPDGADAAADITEDDDAPAAAAVTDEEIKVPDGVMRDPGYVVYKPKIDVAAKQAELQALKDQREAGDIDPEDYAVKFVEITREIDREENRREQAEQYNEGVNKRLASEYEGDFTMWAEQDANKALVSNDSLYSAFCGKLERLIKAHPTASNTALFDTARKLVEKDLGILKAAPGKDDKKTPAPPADMKKKPDAPVASSIGGAPGAKAGTDVGGGKFARLNQLVAAGKTLEVDKELKRFSPAEREEWARS